MADRQKIVEEMFSRFLNIEVSDEVKGKLDLSMFDLIPSNSGDGAVFGCTHDGGLVVAIPTP